MHPDVRAAFKEAITQALEACRLGVPASSELSLVWNRGQPGQWSGAFEEVPSLGADFLRLPWAGYAEQLDGLLRQHHLDHCGLVGSPLLGQSNLPTEQRVQQVVAHLWHLRGDFNVPAAMIDEVLDEVSAFLDSPTVEIGFIAPLLNFSGPRGANSFSLVPELTISKLTDAQVTRIFGGSPFRPSPLSAWRFAPIEWAFTGTIREPKLLGQQEGPPAFGSHEELRQRLNRGLLALRTFNSGPIGYDFVRLTPVRFTPYVMGEMSQRFGDSYVPLGSYALADSEIVPLQRHAALVAGRLHPSLESACSRLSEGEIRLQARDRIFDAVVGLEAILLADTPEKDRGELRYRFGTNYAALFDSPAERLDAFRLAKSLYDLRSGIAHGAALPEAVRFGGQDVALNEVGTRACEILRSTIQRFLPEHDHPPYLDAGYWPERLFRVEGAPPGVAG